MERRQLSGQRGEKVNPDLARRYQRDRGHSGTTGWVQDCPSPVRLVGVSTASSEPCLEGAQAGLDFVVLPTGRPANFQATAPKTPRFFLPETLRATKGVQRKSG